MRLINTETLQLEEFWGSLPSYAILSHTWGIDEMTYDELVAEEAQISLQWEKIRRTWFASIRRRLEPCLGGHLLHQ